MNKKEQKKKTYHRLETRLNVSSPFYFSPFSFLGVADRVVIKKTPPKKG